jgi:hypothetical protein
MQTQLPQQHSEASRALATAFPTEATRPVLLTVEQCATRNPAFTPAALRNLIFKAAPRHSTMGEIPGNGLIEAGAVVRLGRKVLINEAKFLAWVSGGGK